MASRRLVIDMPLDEQSTGKKEVGSNHIKCTVLRLCKSILKLRMPLWNDVPNMYVQNDVPINITAEHWRNSPQMPPQ